MDPFKAVADYYAERLNGNEKAMQFVQQTLGYTAQEAVERGVGFADRTLGTNLPHSRVKQGNEVRSLLIEAGIYKPSGHELLRGYVTEPMRNEQGQIIGLKGYKLDRKATGPERIELRSTEPTALAAGATSNAIPAANAVGSQQRTEQPSLTTDNNDLLFTRDDRRYRIRGVERNSNLLQLKVSLMVNRQSLCHLDVLDLSKAAARKSFIKAAATELYVDADTIKQDIGQLLMELETYQFDRIAKLKTPKLTTVQLSEAEQQAAMQLLKDPNLLERIAADMETCGIVGEKANKLVGYLAATSRKLDAPLAVVIQSSSSAGKTSLMDAVLAMMPSEDVQRYSALTGQSLYYLSSDKIKHKILAISEDAGIGGAVYSLKLLQSEGELRHATVGRGKDGQAQTQEHHVEGPVQIFLTTTAMEIDEELANRCMVLSVDESHSQTSAIQSKQRMSFTAEFTRDGFQAQQLRQLHQNAQRLLSPLKVFNPYAPQLSFPSHKTRMRRDQLKYLTLINTVAFLHQHQRASFTIETSEGPKQAINVTRTDIAIANRLAGEVLGRSLDELAPQTRGLLQRLHEYVENQARQRDVPRDAVRFSRREL